MSSWGERQRGLSLPLVVLGLLLFFLLVGALGFFFLSSAANGPTPTPTPTGLEGTWWDERQQQAYLHLERDKLIVTYESQQREFQLYRDLYRWDAPDGSHVELTPVEEKLQWLKFNPGDGSNEKRILTRSKPHEP